MNQTTDPGELDRHLAAMRAGGQRLARVLLGGRQVWIRRAVAKRLRVQWSKGFPRRLLAREVRLLRAMGARGAPVPAVLAAGDDYLVLEDCGRVLSDLLAEAPEAAAAEALMAATGAALARLHALGCTHGRPYIRDILVSERGEVRFTDLERGSRLDAGPGYRARDLTMLVLSVHARFPGERAAALAEPLIAAYFAAAPGMVGPTARWCRRWRWLAVATAPLRWHEARHKPHKPWKEYAALPPTLERLTQVTTRDRARGRTGTGA